MLIRGITPGGVYLKSQSYPQILAQRIVWSGYARYTRIYLLIYNKINKHTRFTRIDVAKIQQRYVNLRRDPEASDQRISDLCD